LRFRAIDGLRGLAVLAVVAHHMNMKAGHSFTAGARGVDLFFVISGLCLSLPSLTRLHEGKPFDFRLGQFALSRFWRIAPPYWVAIALFGLLSLTPFGVPSIKGPAHPIELAQDASLFLTGLGPAYNPSFWTLGIEARWYVVFPALLLVYTKSKVGFAAIAVVAYVWYKSPFGAPDLGTLPCFMLGIVAADLFVRGHARYAIWLPAAIVAFIAAVFTDHSLDHGAPVWQAAAFLIVIAGLGIGSRVMSWWPLVFVGGASYSVYLVHGPIMTWLAHEGLDPLPAACFGVGAGILFWACIEIPTLKISAKIKLPPAVLPGVSQVINRSPARLQEVTSHDSKVVHRRTSQF
jgi:peptidoglycan/LPS O-acetylase OafA/YrhL